MATAPLFESSDSESDFDGFTEQDLANATKKLSLFETASDIEISDDDNSSDSCSDSEAELDLPQLILPNPNDLNFSQDLHDIDIREFTENTGVTHNLDHAVAKECEYFELIFPPDMIECLVTETNRYAKQRQEAVGLTDNGWTETHSNEMRAFIGINILMGIHSLPEQDLYWSEDKFLGVPAVQEVMSQNRFRKLSQYLHCNNNDTAAPRGTDDYNPLHKVQLTIDRLQETFSAQYRPRRDLAIDEAMIAFQGRNFMKQYLPAKPTKWGFKSWTLAESKSGYVCDFSIYKGKSKVPLPHGLGYQVVMTLSERHQRKYHHLFFDNYFSSVKLLRDLEAAGTYACSTVQANRKGIPESVKKPGKLTRGQSITEQAGNLIATVWRDKRNVNIIATNCNPSTVKVPRRKGKEIVQVDCPSAIVNYNQNMGGVDLSDQYRSYYPVGRHSKKFWKALLWYLVNMALVNSYIIYKLTCEKVQCKKVKSHLKFRMAIVHQMIGGFTSRQRAGRKAAEKPVIEESNMPGHVLIKGEKKLACVNCSQLKIRTPKDRSVQTTFKCKSCGVYLCKGGCLITYHSRHSK